MKKNLFLPVFFISSFAIISANCQVIRHDPTPKSADTTRTEAIIASDTLNLEEAILVSEIDTNESFAQEFIRDSFRFQWGIRGGVSQSQMEISSIMPSRINEGGTPVLVNGIVAREQLQSNSKYTMGYSAGVFGRVSRGTFFLQPEILYSKKGGVYDVLDRKGNLLNRVNAGFDLIDVPLLLGIKFRKSRVFFGPVTSFAFKLNDAFRDNLRQYSVIRIDQSFLQRPVVNFMSGVGFEFGQFFFDFRYESGLANYTDLDIGPVSNPARFRFSSNVILFSIGIIQ